MKNIDSLQVVSSSELASQNGQTPYREVSNTPFRVWANNALSAANPDLPTLGLPAVLPRRFQLIDVNGTLQPKTNFEEVDDYKVPLINSLTAGESLFANWFITVIQSKQGEIDAIFRLIAADIRKEFPELGLNNKDARLKAWEVVNGTPLEGKQAELDELKKNPPTEVAEGYDHAAVIAELEAEIAGLTVRFEELAEIHAANIRDIYRISSTASDPKSRDILFAAFFLASRVDPNIAIPDILSMGMDQIDKLSALWKLESNKGIPPEEPKTEPEPNPEPDSEDDSEGKKEPKAATETEPTT